MFKSLFFSSLLIGTMLLGINVPETLAGDGYYRGRGRGHHRHYVEKHRHVYHERHVHRHHVHRHYERPRYRHHNVPAYGDYDHGYDYRPRRHARHPGVNVHIGIPLPPLPPLPHHFIFRELYR